MSLVEVVPDVEVFDEGRARETLALVEQAMASWITTTVELADLVYRTQQDQCWRVDEDYRAALASSAIALGANGSQRETWLAWKFNRAARTVRSLADYGQLRAILSADPDLPPLAEPELNARPLAKLLRPRYLSSEPVDVTEHHQEIRRIRRAAVERKGAPAVAIAEAIRLAKRSEFAPIRRTFVKSQSKRAAEREALCVKSAKTMRDAGFKLLELGDLDRFDEAIEELAEARRRWKA